MKKIYLIEKLKTFDSPFVTNIQYDTYGYVTSKKKIEKIIKENRSIEKLDVFGNSLIPKQFLNEYIFKEINEIN